MILIIHYDRENKVYIVQPETEMFVVTLTFSCVLFLFKSKSLILSRFFLTGSPNVGFIMEDMRYFTRHTPAVSHNLLPPKYCD